MIQLKFDNYKFVAVCIIVVSVLPDRCNANKLSYQIVKCVRVCVRCECKYATAHVVVVSHLWRNLKAIHTHPRVCVSAISLGLNQLSCHANKIKCQRAYDKCTKIIKCDSNERTRQAKPNGEEEAAATWLSACLPARLKELHFVWFLLAPFFSLSVFRSLAPILHLCNSLLAVNNRNRLGLVAIKICLHRLSFAPCCTDRRQAEHGAQRTAGQKKKPARTVAANSC